MRARRIAAALALGATAAAPLRAQPRRATAENFRDLLVVRYSAMAAGDSAALHRMITDDMTWVVGASGGTVSAAQLLALSAHAANPEPRFEVDSVRVRDLGDVATVAYRRTDHRSVGRTRA